MDVAVCGAARMGQEKPSGCGTWFASCCVACGL
jgi:hypothetical protein